MAPGAKGDVINPFLDPSAHAKQDVPTTLAVGRNVSLTLGSEALIVLGMWAKPFITLESLRRTR